MSSQLSKSLLVIAIGLNILTVVTSKVVFSQEPSTNDAKNSSATTNETMMMRGGAMTFGSSLDNARMHLLEAIMDIKEGNIKGAIIQLNMTDQGIKMHEKEMMDMKNTMKEVLSVNKSKVQNETS